MELVAQGDIVTVVEVNGQYMTEEVYRQYLHEKKEALYRKFSGMRDEWVTHRANSGVEARWRRAQTMYYGDQEEEVNRFVETLKVGPRVQKAASPTRSRVVVNIVRPKCDQAVARLAEILLPVDDRNWTIRPTPRPDLANMAEDERPTVDPMTRQPTGLTMAQEVELVTDQAKEHAENMQTLIDDNLTECNYNGQSRKMLEYGVRLGTGVIKGPFPAYREKKSWEPGPDGTYALIIKQEIYPVSEALDPGNVYFDPAAGRDHQKGRGVLERVPNVTPKELRKLAKVPGYDPEAIRRVLTDGPKSLRVDSATLLREPSPDGSFEMWIYHGDIEPEDMNILSSGNVGDPLEDVEFGVLIIVNDTVIGTLESWSQDGTLPYDVWNWREADDSPYGYGLPDELVSQQRVINGAWRQVMDNARYSMGGQIVMKKGKIIPVDNNYNDVYPGKQWYAKDDVEDVRDAFTVFEFASHVQELMLVVEAAMNLSEIETGIPRILSGEEGGVPETLGGMVLRFNSANTVLRLRVKRYDDNITKPHINRYYDFHMLNTDDPAIKGDFEIDARGSSSLIERDVQNQAILNLSNITSNPRYAPWMKERQELEAILKAFRIDPQDIMKNDQEMQEFLEQQAQQGTPEDPRITAAKIQAEAKMAEIQDRQQAREYDAVDSQAERELRLAGLQQDRERRQLEFQATATNQQLQREVTIAKMLQDGELSREEMESRERLDKIKIADGRERFNAEMYVKTTQGSGI